MAEYPNRWGLTPQKPLRRAYEQNPKMVSNWLYEQYPAIAARAKQEKAEVHWGDGTGLCSDSQHGRSYAPKFKRPAIRLCAKRDRINIQKSHMRHRRFFIAGLIITNMVCNYKVSLRKRL